MTCVVALICSDPNQEIMELEMMEIPSKAISLQILQLTSGLDMSINMMIIQQSIGFKIILKIEKD